MTKKEQAIELFNDCDKLNIKYELQGNWVVCDPLPMHLTMKAIKLGDAMAKVLRERQL